MVGIEAILVLVGIRMRELRDGHCDESIPALILLVNPA